MNFNQGPPSRKRINQQPPLKRNKLPMPIYNPNRNMKQSKEINAKATSKLNLTKINDTLSKIKLGIAIYNVFRENKKIED